MISRLAKYILLLVAITVASNANAQRIILDESLSDWADVTTIVQDGGDVSSGLDIESLGVYNDENYLFLRLTFSQEISFQENNLLEFYIDFDNDAGTGYSQNGIGAELRYFPGQRLGFVKKGNQASVQVRHDDIGWVSSPTVTSTYFEIAIQRNFVVDGESFEMGNQIRVSVLNQAAQVESVPNDIGGLLYSLNNDISPLPPVQLDKSSDHHIRFVSYNVLFGGLFDFSRQLAFGRILKAVKPDIIAFQEIYDQSAQTTADVMENFLPSASGEQWFFDDVGNDNKLISRYPIVESAAIDGNAAFHVDLGDQGPLLVISAHLPCCENDVQRQGEVDHIIAFLRDIRDGVGAFDLPIGTPIIICGDMNLVGFRQQYISLFTGDIINESIFGNDYQPDWGKASLGDAKPLTTALPFSYTWYNPGGSFSAGRLDFVFYTKSRLIIENSYSLQTSALDNSLLSQYGMFAGDSEIASDHLPVVVDFDFLPNSTTDLTDNPIHIYPNPVKDVLTISLPNDESIDEVFVYDVKGQLVFHQYLSNNQSAYITVNVDHLQSGTYSISLAKDRLITHNQLINIIK